MIKIFQALPSYFYSVKGLGELGSRGGEGGGGGGGGWGGRYVIASDLPMAISFRVCSGNK